MSKQIRYFIVEYILRPPILVIGFVVSKLYWLLIGWWYDRRVATQEQQELVREVNEQMWFLFHDHGAKIVPNGDIGHLAVLDCPIVTIAVEGLLFRFIEHRGDRQVQVASERSEKEWYELSALLNSMAPDKYRRHSIVFFHDAARLLKDGLSTVKEAFSEDRYADVKDRLHDSYENEMAITHQVQKAINRGLGER